MNKTITVNIGGLVFHVDENAYEKLKQYLHSIRKYFTAEDGRDEIVQDIESRIAEMFQERLKDLKQVVVMEDVDHVIGVMGRPEQFAEGAEAFESEKRTRTGSRRLYRDTDDKIISGVCSGLGHYIGLDPVWVRLLFVLVTLFSGGFLIVAYLILLVIVPKAASPAEKLEMKGEPVTIESLKKYTGEGYDGIKNKFSDLSEDAKEFGRSSGVRKAGGVIERFFEVVIDVIGWLLKAFIIFIGVVLLITAIGMLLAFVVSLLGIFGVAGITLPMFANDLFLSSGQQVMGTIALFLVFALPVLFLVSLIIKAIFKIPYSNKIIGLSTLILWIVGLIMLAIVSIGVGSEFNHDKKVVNQIVLSEPESNFQTLTLEGAPISDDLNIVNMFESFSVSSDGESIAWGDVDMDVEVSQDDRFQLIQTKSSNGATLKEAINNANAINYSFSVEDSTVTFDQYFIIPPSTKYRGQELDMTLLVPVGKSIYLDPSVRDVIYDIDNVTNTYDGDMMGKTWTMTEEGLECIGCIGIEKKKEERIIFNNDDGENVDVRIGKGGVHINIDENGESHDIDAKTIDISEDGVYIRGENNEEIKINKDGIKINKD
ncbi:MAG: PspC domain-containing protein [Bacteroidia bacterium]|nr:PspC domain-containing protein [Bacteroidia bacterium]